MAGAGSRGGFVACACTGPAAARAIAEEGVTILNGVPATYQRLLEYKSVSGVEQLDRGSLRLIAVAGAPLDRILLETDAPYLAPPPHRGRRNEPAYTTHTAKVGAALFGLPLTQFAAATEANFDRLFTRAKLSAKAA